MASLGWLLNLGFAGSQATGVEVGATSQLGSYSASGAITLERVSGGTSQLGAITATGGITLERAIGATSQLGTYSASGGISVVDPKFLGGTSQLGAYSASGGITLERILGATSQLGGYTASGGITVSGEVATVSGGAKPRRRHRQFANIDGKLVEVASFKEAQALIDHFNKGKAVKKAKKRRLTFANGPYVSVYDADAMPQRDIKKLLKSYHDDEEMLLLLMMVA